MNLKTHRLGILACLIFAGWETGVAQFSPGELSKVHQQLEGMNNCLRCHETGNEISGANCLTCHQEIKAARDAKRGYHFKIAAQQCVSCHKEHLGRDAQTTQFDTKTFDHAQTGFVRTGKHASIECAGCHTRKNIKDVRVLDIIANTGKQTYLGLVQTCVSCHQDKHNNTLGSDCRGCHDAKAWSPVAVTFDHAKTKFNLVGKHRMIVCSKCHTELDHKEKNKPLLFETRTFSSCTPCHVSPHSDGFAKQACSTCHSAEDWKILRTTGRFNHDVTAFKLVGKHAMLACEKCHKDGNKSVPGTSMRLAHSKCTDCHVDSHKGEFKAKYNNECEKCHTTFGFQPSTFTLAAHSVVRFPLKGAHLATPCEKCHVRGLDGRRSFHFESVRCESCHKDKHGGQFVGEMAEQSCAVCHSTTDWFPESFDHSRTTFALVGKHARTKCANCHTPSKAGATEAVQYRGTTTTCESCHKEIHAGQFAVNGATNCKACHSPEGWKQLSFVHGTQSVFVLSGAHTRVECRQCHREERKGETTFVRYKPMSIQCESCHAQGSLGNG